MTTTPAPKAQQPAARTAVMPVFAIKAKDNLATHAICAYYAACLCHNLIEQAREVEAALDEIMDWREAHKSLCKWPDHTHVSAGLPGSGSELDAPPAEPAPISELPMIDGRQPVIRHTEDHGHGDPQGYYIADRSVLYELRSDGKWHRGFDCKGNVWPSVRAAQGFVREVAQRHAPISGETDADDLGMRG